MKTFTYKNEQYFRVFPGRKLLNSNMMYSVLTRGDIFAVRVSDMKLTILPGRAAMVTATPAKIIKPRGARAAVQLALAL